MKFICDICNWDYGRTLGYPVSGISAGILPEESAEAAEHMQLPAETGPGGTN